MALDRVAEVTPIVLVELLDLDHLVVDLAVEVAVRVVDVGDAARHAGAEVAAGVAEHDHATAGHVLAAVVADALDDRGGARVADAEALADDAAQEDLAAVAPYPITLPAMIWSSATNGEVTGGRTMMRPPDRPLPR